MSFLIQTLEGTQAVRNVPGTMVCIGIDADVWQQGRDKLFAKYNITGIDDNGWLLCEPKPDVQVECYQVLTETPFTIKSKWGKKCDDGTYEQTGQPGDYVVRAKGNASDLWIVAQKIFDATYEIVK